MLSKKGFLLFAINYIVGFGFIQTVSKSLNLGFWGIIVIATASLIAFTVALVFVRGTRLRPKEGGSYAYSREVDSHNTSFFQGWNQYVSSPLAGAAAPLFLASIITSVLEDYNATFSHYELVIKVVSFVFFVAVIGVTLLGLKTSTKIIFAAGLIKWTVMLLAFAGAIYLFATQDFFMDNMAIERFNASLFVSATMSMFYAFGGIEGVASMATNVKDPKKNAFKVIIMAFIFATAFYIIFYLVLAGAMQAGTGDAFKSVLVGAFGITGVVFYVTATISNKFSSTMNSTIVNARSLAPMAREGQLPAWFAKKNKKDEYQNAIIFDAAFKIVMMFAFVVVPELVGFDFAFTDVLDIWTIAIFIQYIFTFISVIKLSRKLNDKIKPWELFFYGLGIIMMVSLLVLYFIPIPDAGTSLGQMYNNSSEWFNTRWFTLTIQAVTYLIGVGLGFGLYYWNLKKQPLKVK